MASTSHQQEDEETEQRGSEKGEKRHHWQKNMGVFSALRVFWKSKEWDRKKSTFDSSGDLSLILKKKAGRWLGQGPEDDEQQALPPSTITFPCSVCQQEVALEGASLHKKKHIARAALGLPWRDGKKQPASRILAQRRLLISNLWSPLMLNATVLQSINQAFELLWKRQRPEPWKAAKREESFVSSHKLCHLLIKGVAACENRKTGRNDKLTVIDGFGNKPNVCFLGLFRGHNGASAADLVAEELPVLLLHQLSKFDPSYQMTRGQQQVIDSFLSVFREDYRAMEHLFFSQDTGAHRRGCEDIHKAFAQAFWRMDRLLRLGRKEVSRVLWSGCSAVTCLLEGKVKYPYADMNWRKIKSNDKLANSFLSQTMPHVISGILHVANTGNVQAVLCRNGKGFCLTKEHTTENTNERRRVLENGALITANEPYGLLEGHIKTTRGLGFHGNLKLKKYIIPAPETISVPIDDLCQFLILATNGLWEVLDKEEVIALAITLLQTYKETCASIIQNKSCNKPLYLTISDKSITESETNIHILFQYNPESKEYMSTTNLKNNLLASKYSEHGAIPPEMTNHESCTEDETDRPKSTDDGQRSEEESHAKNFFEGAAEYVSHELVNAALQAGSTDNITVMVIFFNGSEYHLLI